MNETGSETESESATATVTGSALSPQQVARAYDRFVSARWRGEDEAADTVAMWFEAHWVTQPPPEPDSPPAGASVLGGSGRGIRWYARDDLLFGYVPGHKEGCYRVATAEAVPTITAPWDAAPAPRAPADRLVHLAGSTHSEDRLPHEPTPEIPTADRVLSQTPGPRRSPTAH